MKQNLSEFIDNYISNNYDDVTPDEFTGGSVQLTLGRTSLKTNYKVHFFFGYDCNKNPISKTVDIKLADVSKWLEAISSKISLTLLELQSLKEDDLNDFDSLLNNINKSSVGSKGSEVVGNKGKKVEGIEVEVRTPSSTSSLTPSSTSSLTMSSAMAVSTYLRDKLIEFNPSDTSLKPDKWTADIERAIRLDGICEDDLKSCIDWIFSDEKGSFWIANIRSGKALRKHYQKMSAQAKVSYSKKPKMDKIYGAGLSASEIINNMKETA